MRLLLPEYVRDGDVCLLSGPEGCGKTTLAAHVGIALVTGRPILGWATAEKPMPVYYVGPREVAAVVNRVARSMCGPLPPWFHDCTEIPVVNAGSLLILDRGRFAEGTSSPDLVDYVKDLRRIVAGTGAVLIVHPSTKGEGLGWSTLFALMDSVWAIEASAGRRLVHYKSRHEHPHQPIDLQLDPVVGIRARRTVVY